MLEHVPRLVSMRPGTNRSAWLVICTSRVYPIPTCGLASAIAMLPARQMSRSARYAGDVNAASASPPRSLGDPLRPPVHYPGVLSKVDIRQFGKPLRYHHVHHQRVHRLQLGIAHRHEVTGGELGEAGVVRFPGGANRCGLRRCGATRSAGRSIGRRGQDHQNRHHRQRKRGGSDVPPKATGTLAGRGRCRLAAGLGRRAERIPDPDFLRAGSGIARPSRNLAEKKTAP